MRLRKGSLNHLEKSRKVPRGDSFKESCKMSKAFAEGEDGARGEGGRSLKSVLNVNWQKVQERTCKQASSQASSLGSRAWKSSFSLPQSLRNMLSLSLPVATCRHRAESPGSCLCPGSFRCHQGSGKRGFLKE